MVYASLVNSEGNLVQTCRCTWRNPGCSGALAMVLVPGSRGVYASVIPESILAGEGVYTSRGRGPLKALSTTRK
jgi:hypothetical protein